VIFGLARVEHLDDVGILSPISASTRFFYEKDGTR
jgi:hypothetical protein